ncbi:hypothetical protein HAX54_034740 [Datura stramonium]|uniref:Putative plant transposon protein domain-containing protein n=1 Tax=Datura stramonium TaxID=4076 RepID=A0ABS8VFP2_DATST|nr:hypothetical protein [Datura stramonium]
MTSVGGWSHYPEGVPCVDTIKLVDKIWRREGKKDAILLVVMKQMELLTNYVKGFHAKNSHAIHDYDDGYYGNQCWNNVQFVDTSSQESTEVLPPHMESTIEVVLEKVLATEEGVQDLRSKLLDLTTTVKNHDVIIQHSEEQMNELASHMVAPTTTNNTAPRKDIVDNDVLEWEIEEEAIEELIVDVFLKGARARGSRNAISNQLIVLGRANPTTSIPPSEGRRQRKPILMGSQRDCIRLIPSRNTSEVPIKVAILLYCIMEHVNINVREIISDQFRRKSKKQATTLPFPTLVSMLCMRDAFPLLRSLDKTIRAHGVITLATKTDKEAPMIK